MSEAVDKRRGLIAALLVGLQILVLGGLWLHANYPLHFGEKIQLGIQPIDPRSLFRGQFVRLNYQIANARSIPKADGISDSLPPGTTVYVTLEQKGELWVATRLSTQKPKQGTFIRGRTRNRYWIIYGIEAYFADPTRAKEIEKEFFRLSRELPDRRSGHSIATAVVMLAPNGQASLVDIKLGLELNQAH